MNHFGTIPTLIVDLSPFCDLKCIMCPQGRAERGSRKVMSEKLIEKLVNSLANYKPGVGAILPFWNGEPLYNKNFPIFVKKIMEKQTIGANFGSISIHTNCMNLNEEISELIIKSEIFSPITLSIDSATEKTYQTIRRGGDFNRIVSNIEKFLKLRSKLGKSKPRLIFQFIAMEENIKEVELFKKFWGELLSKNGCNFEVIFSDENLQSDKDYIFIRKLIPEKEDEKYLSRAEELHKLAMGVEEKKIENPKIKPNDTMEIVKDDVEVRGPCPIIFSHLGIKYDGKASPCCRDFEAKIEVGDLNTQEIGEIWTGNKIKEYRLAHIEGRFDDVPLCGECGGLPFGNITHDNIINYLKSIGEEKYINPYLKRMKLI